MSKLICQNCQDVIESDQEKCPVCEKEAPHIYQYKNSDDYLKQEIPRVLEERFGEGLNEMVSGLECVIINVELKKQKYAANEMLKYTGLNFDSCFEDGHHRTCILKTPGSADFLIQSQLNSNNPFSFFNTFPKSKNLPNTRLET